MLAPLKLDAAAPPCTVEDIAETKPRPVDLNQLYTALGRVTSEDGELRAIPLTDELKNNLADIFRVDHPRTKLDQFYRMLYALAQAYPWDERREVSLAGPSLAVILKVAGVIDNPDFLRRLDTFHLSYPVGRDPLYQVEYRGDETEFPLNHGKGFTLWRNGMCQWTKSLLFKKKFSFRLQLKTRSHNLLVYDFHGADLVGDFGTKLPLISIDLNYVALSSVEFIEGTNQGIVKARVSRHEFEVNNHSWLLKQVTRMVGDTSTQPIDW